MTRLVMIAALLGLTVACAAASEPSAATPPPAEPAAMEAAPALPPGASAPEVQLAQYDAPAPHYGAPVSCAIERVPTLRGVRLEARADGFDPADLLEYEFVVTRRGSGGSSDIMQSGEVSEPMLGAVDFDAGGRWRAELILRDAEGEVCAAELNS